MSSFRCPAGHLVTLAFGDEEVRLPCPTCKADVYRFRDLVMDEESPAMAPRRASPPATRRLSPRAKQTSAALCAAVLLAGVVVYLLHRPSPSHGAVSQGPLLPVAPAPATTAVKPSAVSITELKAEPIDAGAVTVRFRLTNRSGAPMDYPRLSVQWQGVAEADQLIARDAYAHPPLPFTTTDVILELARPQGATGIDVSIAY